MDSTKLWRLLHFYLSTTLSIFHYFLSGLLNLNRIDPILITFIDSILSLYFRFCDLSPCTVDIDDQTTLHFWTPNHRRFNKPALIMVHGYGGTSPWQFLYQVGSLSRTFNLYIPDLLFFGKSYTNRSDRTDGFQARCIVEGLKGLGVDRFAVYGVSYGGFVSYRMAEMYPKEVEKVVIVSSGIVYCDDQKEEYLKKIGRNLLEILLPDNPHDLRLLVNLSMHEYNPLKLLPEFLLRQFITVMYDRHRKEKSELVEHLLAKETNTNLPILTQETLIIWGNQDKVFPVDLAYQLQRHLGPKSRLEIIKDTGHAANLESPYVVNSLIKSFVSCAS